MKKQNIIHLVTVSIVALCTGFILGLAADRLMPDQYTYGSELIEEATYSLQAYRQPTQLRDQRVIVYEDLLDQQHAAAPDEEID